MTRPVRSRDRSILAAHARRALAPALLVTVLSACATSPPTRFYELVPIAGEDVGSPIAVRVDAVTIPASHDRPQIVTAAGGPARALAEFDRWIEPLDEGIQRVLALDLAARLGEDRVPRGMQRAEPSLALFVRFERIAFRPGGTSSADVALTFERVGDPWTVHATLEAETGPAAADVPDAASRMLADLADLIAAEVAGAG